jgi:alpha-tubulin suppressor-like RCC1 family protein
MKSARVSKPFDTSVFTKIITLATSRGSHSLALKKDGTVWAWGGNWAGQLGNGADITSSNLPVQVSGLN